MTDWLKQNPFVGALVSIATAVTVLGGYLTFAQANRLGEEEAAFQEKKALLERLKRNKPFPDEANFEATKKETAEAQSLLDELAKDFHIEAPAIGPQAFQDALSKSVKEINDVATARGVMLPEGFYLGFETYKTQPPSAEAAPQLAVQLRSVHAVAKVLVESKINSLGPIVRAPLPAEFLGETKQEPGEDTKRKKKGEDDMPEFAMAPFDVNFTADQTSFRLAFNRILDIAPPVFVRMVAVANSQPAPPSKAATAEATEAADQAQEPGAIKPVFGREILTVDLRLASVAASSNTP